MNTITIMKGLNMSANNTSSRFHCSSLLGRRIIALCCIVSLVILPLQPAWAMSSTIEYYHYNHQGSLLEVYDGTTNKRLLSQAWSPWGERQVLHTAVGNKNNTASLLASGLPVRMGYTGHKELLATGLAFAGDTRLYDARLKRFLNSDDRTTGGIRGQNRYSYAYNNPMTYIDPDGRAPRISIRYMRSSSHGVSGGTLEALTKLASSLSSGMLEASRGVTSSLWMNFLLHGGGIEMLAASVRAYQGAARVASGIRDFVRPKYSPAPYVEKLAVLNFGVGATMVGSGMYFDDSNMVGMGSVLMASPGRSLAAVNGPNVMDRLARNIAFVAGSNFIAAAAAFTRAGIQGGGEAVGRAMAANIVVSSHIILSDRLFIVPASHVSLPTSTRVANSMGTLARRRAVYTAAILGYTGVVYGGLAEAALINGANDIARAAAVGSAFPLSFLLQGFNMNGPGGPSLRSQTFYQSRFLIGAAFFALASIIDAYIPSDEFGSGDLGSGSGM